MTDSLFSALGALFAGGFGVLLLAALAGLIVILWDWRLALVGAVVLQLAVLGLLVYVHHIPGVLAGGQLLAAVLAAAILTAASIMHPDAILRRQAGNWLLRLMALAFVVGAWWFLDPGYALPLFSQLETDLLLWIAICGIVLMAFSSSPFFGGTTVLLWSIPLFAFAAVLLPGSGLAVMVGIVDLMVVLACGYLMLVEPANAGGTRRPLPTRRAGAPMTDIPDWAVEPAPRPPLRRPFGRRPAPGRGAAAASTASVSAASASAAGPVAGSGIGSHASEEKTA